MYFVYYALSAGPLVACLFLIFYASQAWHAGQTLPAVGYGAAAFVAVVAATFAPELAKLVGGWRKSGRH